MLFRTMDLIVNEEDVLPIITIIDKYHLWTMSIGNCGWKDRKKWFITFNTTTKRHRLIVRELTKIGTLTLKENDRLYFERV